MKTGQTFDLVEIVGDTPGYKFGVVLGQQCLSEPNLYTDTLTNAHYVKFSYGHHSSPIVLLPRDLKKIGKLTVTKVKS